MGTHTSIKAKESELRKIFRQHVGPDEECTHSLIEDFFDRVLDSKFYNVVFIDESSTEELFDMWCLEEWVAQYVKNHPSEVYSSVTNENKLLRELLAYRVSGVSVLYVDDGELQDNSVAPFIDYRRDSAWEIQKKLKERAMARLPPDFSLESITKK